VVLDGFTLAGLINQDVQFLQKHRVFFVLQHLQLLELRVNLAHLLLKLINVTLPPLENTTNFLALNDSDVLLYLSTSPR